MATKIEWTNETWNPTTGCTKVSPGCDHCYIERTPPLRMQGRAFDKPGIGGATGVLLHHDRIAKPYSWRKPRRVFVNSLSDLFHQDVPDGFIASVFVTMMQTPWHTYQILTKRHDRMRSLLQKWTPVTGRPPWAHTGPWPLPNVWLGVSVEDQKRADLRIPTLLETPAAVRFLSCEPLLGPITLDLDWLGARCCPRCGEYWDVEGSCGPQHDQMIANPSGVRWVIVGGESGPGARPMHPAWAHSLRDQCTLAGVSYFFKQHGEWVPESMWLHRENAPAAFLSVDGTVRPLVNGKPTAAPMARGEDITIRRVGKKRAGRDLDGRTWDQFPDGSR